MASEQPPISPGDLVTRECEAGVWRVVGVQERVYGRGDYLPLGTRVGDPAPPHCVLQRVMEWDFTTPPCTGRGHSPRKAGASITTLRRLTRADLLALQDRIASLAALLPAE